MSATQDLIEVYAPQDACEVVLLKQLLEEEGIDVYVVNDNMEGVMGEVPFAYARPRIWVKTSQSQAARAICEAFDQRLSERAKGAPVSQTLFCYHCGETLSEKTNTCPACGGPLS